MHTFFKKTVVLEVSKERKNWLVATLLEKPGNFLFFKISQELKLKKKNRKSYIKIYLGTKNQKHVMSSLKNLFLYNLLALKL